MPRNENWTRDQLILAFDLYCRTPFGKLHHRNPDIITLAEAIGRTPSALAWKLSNFARLDPSLQQRNIKGASHGSKGEEEIWQQFYENPDALVVESERLSSRAQGPRAVLDKPLPEGTTRQTTVRARIHQDFFRAAVLAAYGGNCCITGLRTPQLLNASHIVPWSVDPKNRTNPRNGLCLNALHDRAFDAGLLTITTDYRVEISPAISRVHNKAEAELLMHFDGRKITLPDRFIPDTQFLQFHRENIFVHKAGVSNKTRARCTNAGT
jgi:putative restriction endonuclease